MAKVTIQSMARDLGLSRNTISMALKGNGLVAPRTREMVLEYAQKSGYIASSAQGGENDGKGEAACVYQIMILRKPDVAVFWDKIINGISEEASRNRCRTQVAVVTPEEEAAQQLPPGLDEGIQAVFCVKLMDRNYIRRIRQKGIAVFLLDDYIDDGDVMAGDVVKMESFYPVVQMTRHLIGQGMTKIGFLNDSSSVFESMFNRFEGYLYAMKRAGIRPEPELVKPDVESDSFYSLETFERIVESYREMPEAVVCGNDQIAMLLTKALRRKGLRVPEDVAVMGFDNDEEGMLEPFFTTVHVDAKWLGRRMVQCFLWRIQHPDAPYEKIVVNGQVIIRKSSCRDGKK